MLSESYITKLYYRKFFKILFPSAVLISAAGLAVCLFVLNGKFIIPFTLLSIFLIAISFAVPFAFAKDDTQKGLKAQKIFLSEGFTCKFCDTYRKIYIDKGNAFPPHIIKCASYYEKICEHDTADMLLNRIRKPERLDRESRFLYCILTLNLCGKTGDWTKGEDIRKKNIGFMQKYVDKQKNPEYEVNMYIALSLIDCACKHYADAFTLLNFGYKPSGKNDTNFLDILINAVYIYSKTKNDDNLNTAINNASTFLENFTSFKYPWSKQYYKDLIKKASCGKL